ncbi:MAG: HAD family hydrolase [bacterium]
MIRAVFLDVDDTLVDFDAAARRGHAEVFGDDDGYAQWCSLTPVFWRRFTSGELDFEAMRRARMAAYVDARRDGGSATSADVFDRDPGELEGRRWSAVEAGFECYPDVPDCLAALRQQKLLVGVITNNESDHQRRKLATVGLADAFDVVVISGEVGVAKPNPEVFRLACRRAGVEPSEAVHVGDLLEIDAAAAVGAGLRGVWLDRHGIDASLPEGVTRLETLADLPAWLEQGRSSDADRP